MFSFAEIAAREPPFRSRLAPKFVSPTIAPQSWPVPWFNK
jgi:hypothetical protein